MSVYASIYLMAVSQPTSPTYALQVISHLFIVFFLCDAVFFQPDGLHGDETLGKSVSFCVSGCEVDQWDKSRQYAAPEVCLRYGVLVGVGG